MTRISLLIVLALCTSLTVSAQIRTCGSTDHMSQLFNNPTFKAEWEQRQKNFKLESQNQVGSKALCPNPVILPMAVHFQGVSNPNQTCLTALAVDQIRILNEDYQGTNSDISNWINNDAQYFPGLNYGETCIQFCLASSNHPSGYGLVEGQPAVTFNTTSGDFNSAFSGYINIYVRNISFLGYSPLGGSGNGDGVVIDDQAFGSNSVSGCGTVSPGAPYNLGRTLTHELGHYLNLDHIWGNGCNVDDGVGDTPQSQNEYYGCPNIPSSSCGSNDMLMNYMDYTNDACMYMFSAGQSTRMENYTAANLQNVINKGFTVCVSQPTLPVSSFSADKTTSCGEVINFTDLSTGSATGWMWDFGDGNTSTQQNPSHTYSAAGTYTVSLTVSNNVGTNSSSKANYITVVLPTATGAGFCAPGTATLTASLTGGDLNWYDAAGTFLATGTSYTTPMLTSTTTYYVEGVTGSTQNVGPLNGASVGSGGFHNASAQYLLFTVLEAFTLKSAWVSSNQAGNRTIELRNGNGGLISSQTINIPNGDSRVTLNLNLTPGSYQIGGNNMNLFRNNSNPSYPYSISNLVEITGSTAGPDYYYYLYDWEVSSGCTSPQIPVVATRTGQAPTSAFTRTISGNTVTFANTSTNATSWLWNFGDGNTSTMQNPTHTYANSGSYTVTLQSTNTCGMESSSQTIVLSVPLIKVNLTAILEGAYNSGSTMNTNLRQLDLFPSTGQPYTVAPWNYSGTEGAGWQPSDYPTNTVDWVLVSLRSGEDANTTVGQAAGLLLADGSISVDIQLSSTNVLPSYFVVLEHRNHLPVMSPTVLPVSNNEINYNFSAADSYTTGLGFGQINVGSIWMLYSGNGYQLNPIGHEIIGEDIIQWNQDNGLFDTYNQSDFNLNGDVNASDKILWSYNNGIFSAVPR